MAKAKEYTIHKIRTEHQRKEIGEELLALLREADRREITAGGRTAWQEIKDSLDLSEESFAAFDHKRNLMAVWGQRKIKTIPGRLIWCLGTYHLHENWFIFAKESRKILIKWATRYGVLYNAVGDFNEESKRWLKWCGATFQEKTRLGNETFIPFTITKATAGKEQK